MSLEVAVGLWWLPSWFVCFWYRKVNIFLINYWTLWIKENIHIYIDGVLKWENCKKCTSLPEKGSVEVFWFLGISYVTDNMHIEPRLS